MVFDCPMMDSRDSGRMIWGYALGGKKNQKMINLGKVTYK